MPKPYKNREFEYHFSQDDENTIFNFKKEFTMLLAFIFPKEITYKKGQMNIELLFLITVIVLIIVLLLYYYGIMKFIWER